MTPFQKEISTGLEPNQKRINLLEPTLIGKVDAVAFWEDPIHGDESTMLVVIDGLWHSTEIWDLDGAKEVFANL